MDVQLSKQSLETLRDLITGDSKLTPYKTGYQLVRFFNQLGFDDVYSHNFPSRWLYVQTKLEQINGSKQLGDCILFYFDPRNWIGAEEIYRKALDKINKIFFYDGYELHIYAHQIYIKLLDKTYIIHDLFNISEEFILEEIDKCSKKINLCDYSGAITSARSLIESVLLFLYKEVYGEEIKYDGNLQNLFNLVQKQLRFAQPQSTNDLLRNLTEELVQIISAISSLRNKTGDAHGHINNLEKPTRAQAVLIVNSAYSFAEFMLGLSK